MERVLEKDRRGKAVTRKIIAVLLALGGLLALRPSAEAKDRGSCATHIAPICHLGEAPICLCETASDFSCRWQCVRR